MSGDAGIRAIVPPFEGGLGVLPSRLDDVGRLAARVAAQFGYDHAVLFGRARAGLAAVLEIVGGPLIVPSNICPAVLAAARAAGVAVRVAPVSRATGLVADAALAEMVSRETSRGVVMVAHLYGFVADYPRTRRAAAANGWLVLENDSVAVKATVPAAFGDVLLTSFGYAKTIDAGGGGAVLTNDSVLARTLAALAAAMAPLDAMAEAREAWFMAMHRQLRQGPPGAAPMTSVIEALMPAELFDVRLGFPERLRAPLALALARLPAMVDSRREVAARWNAALAPLASGLVAPPVAQPVPWRLIRRVPGRRDAVVAALRAAGHDAGTNFPPLAAAFPRLLADQVYDEATAWGDEVLNLWVSPDYDAARIAAAVAVIAGVLEGGGR